jgi:hypothetical protein
MHNGFDPARFDVSAAWPDISYKAWRPTLRTVHRWAQIVGKVKMVLSPPLNHFWHCALQVSPRGFTTNAIPIGPEVLEMEFDLLQHNLHIRSSSGEEKVVPLLPRSVAGFYREVMSAVQALGVDVRIRTRPDEVQDHTPFEKDEENCSYDREAVERLHRSFLTVSSLLESVRSGFYGKSSPVNLFWGTFDLALSFFSGRLAPPRPDADALLRESYSHEVINLGFWAGDDRFPEAAFYGYAAPEPSGFKKSRLTSRAATYDEKLSLFILRYDDVRKEKSPSSTAVSFCRSILDVGMKLGNWDRETLLGTAPATAADVEAAPD